MSMTYSEKLKRHISVPIQYLNHVDEAELDAAIASLPGYPDWDYNSLLKLAASGDLNAIYVVAAHKTGRV